MKQRRRAAIRTTGQTAAIMMVISPGEIDLREPRIEPRPPSVACDRAWWYCERCGAC